MWGRRISAASLWGKFINPRSFRTVEKRYLRLETILLYEKPHVPCFTMYCQTTINGAKAHNKFRSNPQFASRRESIHERLHNAHEKGQSNSLGTASIGTPMTLQKGNEKE